MGRTCFTIGITSSFIFCPNRDDYKVTYRKEDCIMQIYDEKMFKWNRCVGPHGNLGGVDPSKVANVCDKFGVPWYTSAWPYSSGIKAFCMNDKIWNRILKMCKS